MSRIFLIFFTCDFVKYILDFRLSFILGDIAYKEPRLGLASVYFQAFLSAFVQGVTVQLSWVGGH